MYKIPDIAPFRAKLNALDTQMAEPDFYSDQQLVAEVSREHQRLSSLVEKFEAYHAAEKQIKDNEELLADASVDEELQEMAREEITSLEEEREALVKAVLRAMIPPDATDSRNSVVEIRGGAGGDEANIFAGDLFRMYSRFAESRGWRVEVMSSNVADAGGFRKQHPEVVAHPDAAGAQEVIQIGHRGRRVEQQNQRALLLFPVTL